VNTAKIVSNTAGVAPITFANNAHNWRLIGLEVTMTPGLSEYFLINTDNNQTSESQLPSNLIIDRCYIHGDTTNGSSTVQNAIDFQVIGGAMVDSDVRDIVDIGIDSTAIFIYNAPGPYLFQNNFISGASEDILIGGQPHIANEVPSDITFVGNHLWKPLSWMGNGKGYTVKNGFELKDAQRVLVDGNVIEYNWIDGQQGAIILFTVRGGEHLNGCTLCVVQDVTFTHNLVQHSFSGMNISPSDDKQLSLPDQRILVQNNVFADINSSTYGAGSNSNYVIQQLTAPVNYTNAAGIVQNPANNIKIDHNTFATNSAGLNILLYMSNGVGVVQTFEYTNNMADYGRYGIFGDSVGSGATALTTYVSNGLTYNDNTFLTVGNPGGYPAGSLWSTDSTAGFTNYAVGNYQLTVDSPYHNAGTDGRDIGVWDWTAFNAATTKALSGH
jgi:hypothetical protein